LLLRLGATGLVPLASGRTARDVGIVSASPAIAKLFRHLGLFVGRYLVEPGNPVHSSATAIVRYAEDVASGDQVALKLMRNKGEFERELSARGGLELESGLVVNIQACHVPANHGPIPEAWAGLVQEEVTESTTHPYLLVMDKAGESLHHFLSSQVSTQHTHTQHILILGSDLFTFSFMFTFVFVPSFVCCVGHVVSAWLGTTRCGWVISGGRSPRSSSGSTPAASSISTSSHATHSSLQRPRRTRALRATG